MHILFIFLAAIISLGFGWKLGYNVAKHSELLRINAFITKHGSLEAKEGWRKILKEIDEYKV